jgi:hypothetical protein
MFCVHCLVVLALLALLLGGCGRNVNNVDNVDNTGNVPEEEADMPEEETDVPPEIPPLSTFVMEFSDFGSSGSVSAEPGGTGAEWQMVSFSGTDGSSAGDPYSSGDQANWNFAALNVGVWNVLLFVGLIVPVASFAESFNHVPEQQPDYTWVWSYDVTVNEDLYYGELHGKFIDDGVRWEMYVSKEGEYSDFNWYYGESNLPATEGFWILKNKPSDPTDLLQIDWHRNIAEGTSDISYTNIVPNGPENGGYIYYGVTADESFDRFYEIFNKGKGNYTYIEWNYDNQDGRVKATHHFGDDDWHCWNSAHGDISCP